MDLLNALGAIRRTLDFFAGTPDSNEPWAASEEAFEAHFGGSYEFFVEVLQHLDEEQSARFDATLRVNPEAAVLWTLSMDVVE
jgi:predicted alpha/beta superfamily hydrolase